MNIHDNIKNARIKAGLTQTELALAIGVTQKEISRWETGSRTPQVETDRKSTRLNSSHGAKSRMPSSA